MSAHHVLIAQNAANAAKASVLSEVRRAVEQLFPLRAIALSNSLQIAIIVSVATLVFAGFILYRTFVGSPALRSNAGTTLDMHSGKVFLGAQGAKNSSEPPQRPTPTLGANIANNGLVYLQGAFVTSISGSRIRVDLKWREGNFKWAIQTHSKTKFISPSGEAAALEDIDVGDVVSVTGKLTRGGAEPAIAAEYVREK